MKDFFRIRQGGKACKQEHLRLLCAVMLSRGHVLFHHKEVLCALVSSSLAVSAGHHPGAEYLAGQAWQQWGQVRPPISHASTMHQGQVVPAQAVYPMQPVYAGSMAVPQYGYIPAPQHGTQQAVYHQSPGAYTSNSNGYAGNGSNGSAYNGNVSAYPSNGAAYTPARGYQQTQVQQDYNCQASLYLSPTNMIASVLVSQCM